MNDNGHHRKRGCRNQGRPLIHPQTRRPAPLPFAHYQQNLNKQPNLHQPDGVVQNGQYLYDTYSPPHLAHRGLQQHGDQQHLQHHYVAPSWPQPQSVTAHSPPVPPLQQQAPPVLLKDIVQEEELRRLRMENKKLKQVVAALSARLSVALHPTATATTPQDGTGKAPLKRMGRIDEEGQNSEADLSSPQNQRIEHNSQRPKSTKRTIEDEVMLPSKRSRILRKGEVKVPPIQLVPKV